MITSHGSSPKGNHQCVYTGTPAQFAIGNRKSKIANVAVPVVQRIEQGFPKGKAAFQQESPNDIRSIQLAVFEVVD
jgi:hypothetical protein